MRKCLFFVLGCIFGFVLIFSTSGLAEDMISITILYDNYDFKEGLKSDWGFACLIKGIEKTILFDTGTKADVFLHNINALKINPKDVELVVISHNHGDHTGGLSRFLDENSRVSVYIPVSFPPGFSGSVQDKGAEVIRVDKPVKICEGVYLTGEMGVMVKEQSLVLDTDKGSVVITGCAHPGIIDIIKRAKEIVNKDVYLVLGGFHLINKSETELQNIMRDFKELGVMMVGATHCTGDPAIELFKKAYGEHFVQMGVGRVIKISE